MDVDEAFADTLALAARTDPRVRYFLHLLSEGTIPRLAEITHVAGVMGVSVRTLWLWVMERRRPTQ